MKKFLSIFLVLVLMLSLASVAFAADSKIAGDVDNSGQTGMKDITTLRRYLAGGYSIPVFQEAVADVNGDSVINAKDVTILRRFVAGGYDVELFHKVEQKPDETPRIPLP